MRKHPQWPLVKGILLKLQAKNYKALLVGGCVRDLLLNKTPADMDIATSAPPEKVEELFPETKDVGKAFGTILVVENDFGVEVTTFRKDGPYLNGRHPNYVEFSDEKEDSSRRDFTINSMFLNPFTEELIDHFNGRLDLQNKLIKSVGDPHLRFEEDKLRMLRALRFASQLDYQIESKTYIAIKDLAPSIHAVSKERLLIELEKLSCGKSCFRLWEELFKTHLWTSMFSIQQPYIYPKQNELEKFGQKGWLAFVIFMAYWDKYKNQNEWFENFKKWPLSRDFKKQVEGTLGVSETLMSTTSFINKALAFNSVYGILGLELWRFDNWKRKKTQQETESFISRFLDCSDSSGHLPASLIQGRDLLERGHPQGPGIQTQLQKAYELQILNKIKSKEDLLKKLSF